DGIKRDVAQIEQPGEADDDVESERQQDVEDRVVGDAHPGGPDLREREGQHGQRPGDEHDADPARGGMRAPIFHARSPTRSPSSPEGRNTSTRISTMNANTS